MGNPTKKICIIVTSPVSLHSLHKGFYPFLASKGWEVTCIAGPGDRDHQIVRAQGVKTIVMPLAREIDVVADARCLFKLFLFLLRNRFDIVHSSTPKAMLIGMLASALSGHKSRIVTVRGRVYENYKGLKKEIFKGIDWISLKLARLVIPISREMSETLKKEFGIGEKIRFIGSSSNGIDTDYYCRTPENIKKGEEVRRSLNIRAGETVILNVGRIRREKGINELVRAFCRMNVDVPVHLVLVGPYEDADPLEPEVLQTINNRRNIHMPGAILDVIPWYAFADIVAFPSYREGFGNVAIEASSMELPVVASDIMGCREGVLNGVTGILVPPQTVDPLAEALTKLVRDQGLRKRMGQAGRARVVEEFRSEIIWNRLMAVYGSTT